MEMLVTKFSKGKYRNEGELFAEPISDGNVQLMGEMIALRALRTVFAYDNYKVAERLFNGLIRDFHHMNEPGYIISDGYDCVQAAICFLLQFKGRYVSGIYGNTKYRKNVTIKNACYGVVDLYILNFRRKAANNKDVDVYDNKKTPSVNIDHFKETDYTKADEIVEAMHLAQKEKDVLNCYLGGMKLSEVASFLAASGRRFTIATRTPLASAAQTNVLTAIFGGNSRKVRTFRRQAKGACKRSRGG